jgi:hypothetical protein
MSSIRGAPSKLVGPEVQWAAKGPRRGARLAGDDLTPVLTYSTHRADRAVLPADDDDRLARHRRGQEVTRLLDLILMPDADP